MFSVLFQYRIGVMWPYGYWHGGDSLTKRQQQHMARKQWKGSGRVTWKYVSGGSWA